MDSGKEAFRQELEVQSTSAFVQFWRIAEKKDMIDDMPSKTIAFKIFQAGFMQGVIEGCDLLGSLKPNGSEDE